jgi:hypothetical protein
MIDELCREIGHRPSASFPFLVFYYHSDKYSSGRTHSIAAATAMILRIRQASHA